MANEKISQMTAAAAVTDADLVPIVQAGSNMAATRAQLLTGSNNAVIYLVAASGQFVGIKAGAYLIQVRDDGSINLEGQGASLQIDGSGNVLLRGQALTLNAQTGLMSLGQNIGGSVQVQYTPASLSDWATTSPPDLATAIDRIAAAVVGLLGSPIP